MDIIDDMLQYIELLTFWPTNEKSEASYELQTGVSKDRYNC